MDVMRKGRFDAEHLHRDPRVGPTRGAVDKEASHRMRQRHANDKAPHLGHRVSRLDRVVNWYRRGSGR